MNPLPNKRKNRRQPCRDRIIGARIKQARLAAEPPITQRQIADRLGISTQAVQHIEAGRNSLRASYVEDLADVIGTMIYDLIGDLEPTNH